ncbi:MAG: hypothetical protein LQ347_006965 [Umbilicaria vellea]|nr:MAG: hypothetical protein LQ347_006965 [Umbilicaria vellea]
MPSRLVGLPLVRAAARQQPVQLVVAPSAQETLPRACVLVVVPVVVEVETRFGAAARGGAAAVAAVAMAQAVVAGGEAGRAGGLEAGVEGGEAGVEVVLGEGEEGGLGALVGGFEGLGDLVEGLPDARVVAAHCVGCTTRGGRTLPAVAENWLGLMNPSGKGRVMVRDHIVERYSTYIRAASLPSGSGTGTGIGIGPSRPFTIPVQVPLGVSSYCHRHSTKPMV